MGQLSPTPPSDRASGGRSAGTARARIVIAVTMLHGARRVMLALVRVFGKGWRTRGLQCAEGCMGQQSPTPPSECGAWSGGNARARAQLDCRRHAMPHASWREVMLARDGGFGKGCGWREREVSTGRECPRPLAASVRMGPSGAVGGIDVILTRYALIERQVVLDRDPGCTPAGCAMTP